MSLDNRPIYTGGCQCGAVRFRVEGTLGNPSICHCRMCQKAFGNFFAPLVSVTHSDLKWTRGEPKRFQSSNHVKRGFCSECGTPLTYEAPDGIALAIGVFDEPENLAPTVQWGLEDKLPYVDALRDLPGYTSESDPDSVEFVKTMTSYQHPDFDTDEWPVKEAGK
ncbi:GFA family protein [Phyllobacterium sp. SB3]|uniref:GFA family protein n=1 Tax=Phyllobacterium sp. SB3 TaxID=3156073 RepID=UPI0032AFDE99